VASRKVRSGGWGEDRGRPQYKQQYRPAVPQQYRQQYLVHDALQPKHDLVATVGGQALQEQGQGEAGQAVVASVSTCLLLMMLLQDYRCRNALLLATLAAT
jgi:hypothetical protein